MIRNVISALLLILMVYGCGDNDSADTTANKNDPASTTESKNATGEQKSKKIRSNIKLVITGGDMAGTYEATCSDACCSYGIAGEKVFGNQYSENGKGPKELSSVQLMVDDVTTGTKSSSEFLITVSFGELFGENSKSYTINSRNSGTPEGSGKIDIQYSNEKATVKMIGTTKDGIKLDLDMECLIVLTPQNIGQHLQ